MLSKASILGFIWLVNFAKCCSQAPPSVNVYLFPGTGSDARLFSKLTLPEGYSAHHIQYPVPKRGETMTGYAALLAKQVDTTQPFVLIGVSIGGMLCTELSEQLSPKAVIVISSAKCRAELPRHYRMQRWLPLHKLFGPRAIKALSPLAQAVVEPDRNRHKATFKAMLHDKDRRLLKRGVDMIIHWERTSYDPRIVHLHGTNDHTLPLRNIQPTIVVPGGSHMMTLTRGEEISGIIRQLLVSG